MLLIALPDHRPVADGLRVPPPTTTPVPAFATDVFRTRWPAPGRRVRAHQRCRPARWERLIGGRPAHSVANPDKSGTAALRQGLKKRNPARGLLVLGGYRR